MNAWLKMGQEVFPLSHTRPTTFGRDCCDLTISCPAVDMKHALIEYRKESGCFFLRDNNSAFGTYVNDCVIQNSSIRLGDGDIIRFGFGSSSTQFQFNTDSGCNRPFPRHPIVKAVYSQDGGRFLSQTRLKSYPSFTSVSPCVVSPSASCTSVNSSPPPPPPTHIRPLSTKSATDPLSRCNGALGRVSYSTYDGQFRKCNSVDSSDKVDNDSKKEKKISALIEEVDLLRRIEIESQHKDGRIKELVDQADRLQAQLSQAVSNGSNRVEVQSLQKRIIDLENELRMRIEEMAELNEQIFTVKTNSQKQLNDKIREINGLKEELERLRKDKNILSGLLTQVQKDIAMKDATIGRLTKDVERKNYELSDRDGQLASIQTPQCSISKHKLLQSDNDQKQKDLQSSAEKVKVLETSLYKKDAEIATLKKALDKVKVEVRQEKEKYQTALKSSDELSAKIKELEKSEKFASQELVAHANTMTRLRRRMQRLVSLRCRANVLEVIAGDEEDLTDDQIVDLMKQMIEENGGLIVQLAETKKRCDELESDFRLIVSCGEKLKTELQASTGVTEPAAAALLVALRQELNAVQILITPPGLSDFQWILTSMIQVQLKWHSQMVNSLESCGLNVQLSESSLCQHIADLHAKCLENSRQYQESKVELEKAGREFRRDLEDARDRGRREVEERSLEKLEKLMQEREMKITKEKETIVRKEKENYEEQITHEHLKLARLEERFSCIEKELAEKNEELCFYKEQEKQHTLEVEAYRRVENELRAEIMERKWDRRQSQASIEQSIRKRIEQEMTALKEQNAQLTASLASTQERLSKANNRIHRQQLDIAALKSSPGLSGGNSTTSATGYEPKASFEVSQVNEKLRSEIKKLQADLKKMTAEVDQSKSETAEKVGVISELEKQLEASKAEVGQLAELCELGAKCKEEEHEDTIKNQSETIVELRKRIRYLTKGTTSPSFEVPATIAESPEEPSEVVKLARSQRSTTLDQARHMSPTSERSAPSIDRYTMDKFPPDRSKSFDDSPRSDGGRRSGVAPPSSPTDELMILDTVPRVSKSAGRRSTSPGDVSSKSAEKSSEVSAKKDSDHINSSLKENLEMSEEAYACLLKAVADTFSIDKVMSKVPTLTEHTTDKKLLSQQRRNACRDIQSELRCVRDKMVSYESTVRRYDMELARLRTSDRLLEQKGWQIDGLTSDVRSLVDEVACLHASLMKVREELRREKHKNNAATKDRKSWPSGDRTRGGTVIKHSCYQSNSSTNEKVKDRLNSSTLLKRKECEIRLLKEELRKCEKNMERVGKIDQLLADSDCSRLDLIGNSHHCFCSKTSI